MTTIAVTNRRVGKKSRTLTLDHNKSYCANQAPALFEVLEHYTSPQSFGLTIEHMIRQLTDEFHFSTQQLVLALSISEKTLKRWVNAQIVKPSFRNYRRVFSLYCLAKELNDYQF
jgi:hypothetical protein